MYILRPAVWLVQNGGEFLWVGQELAAWCHRMMNTTDHLEGNDLLEVLKAEHSHEEHNA